MGKLNWIENKVCIQLFEVILLNVLTFVSSDLDCSSGDTMHWIYFTSNSWPGQLPAVPLWSCSFCHTVPVARLLHVVCSVCIRDL